MKYITLGIQEYVMGFVFVFISIFGVAQTIAEIPSLGDGLTDSPYEISSLANLKWLSENPDIWGAGLHFLQTADIYASDTRSWNDGKGFLPIGRLTQKFNGSYNGGDFIISDLYINSKITGTGLFGFLHNSTLKNIHLVDANISSTADYTGGIFGSAEEITNLINLSVVNSSIIGVIYVGGIGGGLYKSNVSNCYSRSNYINAHSILVD